MFSDYLLQNWALILVLLAFVISLMTTVFLDKKTIRRYYILIAIVFVLSILVFIEFQMADQGSTSVGRLILMAVRYSATPIITALIMFTLTKRMSWVVFIPAIMLVLIDVISIFTGLVFGLEADGSLRRGPLGYLPFIVAGLYFILLIYILLKRSNKRAMEVVPIVFLFVTLASGVILPFVFGSKFSNIFCTTIAVALFAYYEFTTLSLTKKDALTGLLNRKAYYSDIKRDHASITALVSVDMNGLKTINDNEGHLAGDEALTTLSLCFTNALKRKQSAYRVGGDEFIIVCRKTSEEEVLQLVERIKANVSETPYSCSIGYSYSPQGEKTIDEMLLESDKMMYEVKEQYYLEKGHDRRK